jgi:VanZ family protein
MVYTGMINSLTQWLHQISSTKYKVLAYLWLLITTYLTLTSSSSMRRFNIWDIVGIDKLGHFGFYMIFSFLWAMAYKHLSPMMRFFVLAFVITFGIFMESAQYLMRMGRAFEWLDILANTTGAIIGFVVFLYIDRKTNYNT